jgi:hypothetical protein
MPAKIHVDTAPDRLLDAYVSALARIAEPDGRAFRVQFRFRAPVSLLPGQAAYIRLTPGS